MPAKTFDGLSFPSWQATPGHYWARHHDGSYFVVYFEDGLWYTVGVQNPINAEFDESQVICPIQPPFN